MIKEQALNQFWNSFGIPAYDETAVPDDASYPYITYQTVVDSMDGVVYPTANIWYRSESWKEASEKRLEIQNSLPRLIGVDGGYAYFYMATPFAQRIKDSSDNMIKRYYLNIAIEYLTK